MFSAIICLLLLLHSLKYFLLELFWTYSALSPFFHIFCTFISLCYNFDNLVISSSLLMYLLIHFSSVSTKCLTDLLIFKINNYTQMPKLWLSFWVSSYWINLPSGNNYIFKTTNNDSKGLESENLKSAVLEGHWHLEERSCMGWVSHFCTF